MTAILYDLIREHVDPKIPIGDHNVLYLIGNARAPKLKVPPKTINIRNYKKFNIQEFQHD